MTVTHPRTEVSRIAETFERNRRALRMKASLGQGTARTRVILGPGLRCEVEDGPWHLAAGLSAKHGGAGDAPDPGVLGRAALGSCLATTYALFAARRGVPVDSLSVDVEADYDARGMFGLDGVSPAYGEIRVVVAVETTASRERVEEWLDEADRHTAFLAIFREPQLVRRELRLQASARNR